MAAVNKTSQCMVAVRIEAESPTTMNTAVGETRSIQNSGDDGPMKKTAANNPVDQAR
jgi:hypothetical protein